MSDIKFYCPSCSAKLAINKNASGKKIDCPECKTPIQVPTRSTRGGADTDIIRLPPADLSGKVDELSEQVTAEIEEIRDAVGKLQRHLTSGKSEKVSRAEFDNCLKTVMQLKKAEPATNEELKGFQKEFNALQKAFEKLNELNLSDHGKHLAKADEQLKDIKDKVQPLSKSLAKLEKQQEDLQKQVEALKVPPTAPAAVPTEDVAAVKKALEALEKKLGKHDPSDLQKAITALEHKVEKDAATDLKKDLAAQGKNLDQLEKTAETQGKALAALEKTIKDIDKQLKSVAELEKGIKELDKKFSAKEQALDKLTAAVGGLEDKLKTVEGQVKEGEKRISEQQKARDEQMKDLQKMWGIIDARFGELDANGPSIGERLGILEDNAHRMKEFATGFGTKTADAIKSLQKRIEEIINPEVPEGSDRKGGPPKLPENFDELVFQQSSIERKIQQLEALVKMTSSRVQIIENARRGTMDDEEEEEEE